MTDDMMEDTRQPMLEDTSKTARLHELAKLRGKLESMPPGALLNTSMAGIYLGVSTKTLARWRQARNMGPPFIEPVVAAGSVRSTQPHKYRKSDLDNFINARVNQGGFASMGFAHQVEPWQVNADGAIEGSALSLSIDALLESDPLVATLLDAMVEPWASAAAMRPYRDELEGDMRQALDHVDSNLMTLHFEENTTEATGRRERGGVL